MIRLVIAGSTLLGALSLAATAGSADERPDLDSISRHIAKEPAYVASQPLYGLYLFGPKAQTRVWAVFDKSDRDQAEYDVLHFDRNANGDLTDPDERIVGLDSDRGMQFDVGDFNDPVTGDVHTGLTLSQRNGSSSAVFLRMQYQGKHIVRGGYAREAGPYTQFAASPSKAPILWPCAEGPFSFQRWVREALTIGQDNDFRLFLGHRGRGKNTFCAVGQEFLPPDVPVLATLIYTDSNGKEQRLSNELRERC